MAELFPEFDKKTRVNTCRDCGHREVWTYTNMIISYCNARPSNRTANGMEKVRAKDPACHRYEER